MEAKRDGFLQGAPDAGGAHILAFARSSVGIVDEKGVRQRWIAPALLHRCSMGIEESSWAIMPETVIGLRLQGSAVEDHNRKVIRTSGPGRDLTLQPRGTLARYLAYRGIKFGQVFLPDRLLDRAADADNLPTLSGRLRDDLSFVPEKRLQTLTSDYLRRAFDTNSPATSLEMEGRALLLVDWLQRLHQMPRPGAASPVGGLSSRHLRRVCDFMLEHLAEDICLDDLAELTGLTSKHFARAFKQSTGIPPHQFLIMQRIEAAKRCLVDARTSLADIALLCGFSDQSHFTATFRNVIGVPPGIWRRDQAK
jgi:AraC family transcriptional regulator